MFDSFDGDRDGRIDATELGRALEHYKYANLILQPLRIPSLTSALLSLRVGPHVLDKLVRKYGKSRCGSVTPTSDMNSPLQGLFRHEIGYQAMANLSVNLALKWTWTNLFAHLLLSDRCATCTTNAGEADDHR